MDYIARIKELAEKANSLHILNYNATIDSNKLFNLPATMKQLKDFEQEMCITLPVSLVRYLIELGNGGVGADYGVFSLDEMRQHNAFSMMTKDIPPMLDHSLTDEQWTEFAERYTTLDEKIDYVSDDEVKQIIRQLGEMQKQMIAGGIFISTLGCTMNAILMCRGAAKGEVFILDFDNMDQVYSEPYCCGKFEDWIINDLQQKINSVMQ